MSAKGIVLLFGAFNPFTNAHLHIGRLAKASFPGYEVCYVPAALSYFTGWKQQASADILPGELRYRAACAAAEPEGFWVSDMELTGKVNGKTYNTVAAMREAGYTDIVLCMGTDKVPELETWYRGKELIAENRFLIITRGGSPLAECMTEYTAGFGSHFTELRNEDYSSLSASQVRRAMEAGDWSFVRESVPEGVYEILTAERRE